MFDYIISYYDTSIYFVYLLFFFVDSRVICTGLNGLIETVRFTQIVRLARTKAKY